ncbi:hypothetical protein KIPB_008565 [Kipferlia bialata]|uniref:Uncharacterized protein n=1 Tax=Kipferlia bialata TaxID=797122 RepID=A0A9K3GLK0_9EUKA|nr:hypothetical protein KIPB_008565 [Kipferlia bialata]|eukprot:g8565.t1
MVLVASSIGLGACLVMGNFPGMVLGEDSPKVWEYAPDWLCSNAGICLDWFLDWEDKDTGGVLAFFLAGAWLVIEAFSWVRQKRSYKQYHVHVASEMHKAKLYSHLWAASEKYHKALKKAGEESAITRLSLVKMHESEQSQSQGAHPLSSLSMESLKEDTPSADVVPGLPSRSTAHNPMKFFATPARQKVRRSRAVRGGIKRPRRFSNLAVVSGPTLVDETPPMSPIGEVLSPGGTADGSRWPTHVNE